MSDSSQPREPRATAQRLARNVYSEAILDAAERLFLEVGYAESKMAEVAARAGVAVGTVYKHFESKEAVLASLAVRRREHLFASLGQCEAIDEPRKCLLAIVRHALGAAEAGGALFAVYMQLRSAVESQIKAKGGVDDEETQARFQHAVASAYERGIKRGVFRAGVLSVCFARALCGALNVEMVHWVHTGRTDSLVERGEALLELLLEGALVR